MKNLNTLITKAKSKIMTKVSRIGIYENLGQKEIRNIEDKIGGLYGKPQAVIEAVEDFSHWCETLEI